MELLLLRRRSLFYLIFGTECGWVYRYGNIGLESCDSLAVSGWGCMGMWVDGALWGVIVYVALLLQSAVGYG